MLTRRQLRPWDHLSAQEAHKVTTGGVLCVLCKSEDLVRPRCGSRRVQQKGWVRFSSHLCCVLCRLVRLSPLSYLGQEASVCLID